MSLFIHFCDIPVTKSTSPDIKKAALVIIIIITVSMVYLLLSFYTFNLSGLYI